MNLPVEPFLPEICRRLKEEGRLLLSAAPGAGKTTCVPGALAGAFPQGKIIMVEPRRVAAQAAAVRISALKGTPVGTFAGFAVRGERSFCDETRVLVVTPGVLLRKIQSDPALEDTAAVIFDEFHERSAEYDLLFALVMECCKGFREDLKLLVMSATLDSARALEILKTSAPLEIPGREFPIELNWESDLCPREMIVPRMARAIREMLRKSEGNLLAFFPGTGEIRKCRELLENTLGEEIILEELHGSLPLASQVRVLAPAPDGFRKAVLATNVAESSLTVDNVRCVVDCGYERNPRYNPDSGLTFLETELISQASAAQRAGRAGRTAPGKVLRLWDVHSHSGRKPFKLPEICDCDLAPLALEIALWGAKKEELEWLDAPPQGAYAEAVKLLQLLGAFDKEERPTPFGKKIASYPLHPRIGSIVARGIEAGKGFLALEIATLLENRSDSSFPRESDLALHIEHLRRNLKSYPMHRQMLNHLQALTNLSREEVDPAFCGELLLAGFPDRLAMVRRKNRSAYTLYNGRGATLAENDLLMGKEFLVIPEIGGRSFGDGTVFKAAAIDKAYILEHFSKALTERRSCTFDPDSGKVICRKESCLGAIVLSETPVPPEPGELARGVLEAACKRGIALIPAADKSGAALIRRIAFAHAADPEEFPSFDDGFLAAEAWSFFPELKTLAQIEKLLWTPVLRTLLGEEKWEKLNRLYPEKFRTPAGAEHRIDYSGDTPLLSVKLQEMLGVKIHPTTGMKKTPLKIELLSPAMRPIQITSDLPGFWQGSYALVRKEMKARYPKHEWPEDPAQAPAMLRSVKKSV